jgi:hypothetical protein
MLIATTCDELRPLALSAAAASGVASIDLRSDCMSSSLVCLTTSSTFERNAGFRSLMSTTCMFQVLDVDDLYAPYDRAGLIRRCLCLGLRGCSLCLHESRRPKKRAAIMTDAVKMRMVIPFQFEKQTKKRPIRNLVGV